MDQNFLYMYKQVAGKSARETAKIDELNPVMDFMAHLLDGKHVVVLSGLMDNIEQEAGSAFGGELHKVAPARDTWEMVQPEIASLSVDLRMRLEDFTQNWKGRLNRTAMLPYLKSNGWITEEDGRFRISGKGTRDESKTLYQQSLQDVTAEGVRILALFEGILLRLQETLSGKWHGEVVHDDLSKLLPLLESALRTREMELFKSIRTKLPDYFFNLFTRRVNKWEHRIYTSESELFKNMIWPWYNPARHESGFEGFVLFLVNFIWEIARCIFGMYNRKWRLFLRGLEAPEAKISPVSL